MRQKLPRVIGTLGLVFVLFFSTSGGPYTTETLIHSVGPGLGLLILALVPLVWSVPEALIVGELASMLPEEGGYYRWVDRAFLGFSKWLAHVDVFPGGHGDLSGAVQSIFALFYPRIGRASGMGHLACYDLGRNMDQYSRVGECHSRFDYRRLLHYARFCSIVGSEYAAHHSHSVATVRVGARSRTGRFGRRYLDCALELYRLG